MQRKELDSCLAPEVTINSKQNKQMKNQSKNNQTPRRKH
jgi:hypothetical protein